MAALVEALNDKVIIGFIEFYAYLNFKQNSMAN